MKPFKEFLDDTFFNTVAGSLARVASGFDKQAFLSEALEGLEKLELKQRITRTAELCNKFLPGSFRQQVDQLREIAFDLEVEEKGLSCLFMLEFVATYGLDDFEFSLAALKEFTTVSSAEFAIRPFIINYFEPTMKVLYQWSEDQNHHVRRLASEGSRPRLPWGIQLKMLMENPEPCRPILEKLKTDDSEYVRRSVANHLNDISKDNQKWMLDLVNGWNLEDDRIKWVVKHASRSLLKKGVPEALPLFGYASNPKVRVSELRLSSREIKIGEKINFSFEISSEAKQRQKLMIDYKVHYVKKTGKLSPKVFKLKEITLKPGEVITISKNHSFEEMTIRSHYPGTHYLQLQINGIAEDKTPLQVTD